MKKKKFIPFDSKIHAKWLRKLISRIDLPPEERIERIKQKFNIKEDPS